MTNGKWLMAGAARTRFIISKAFVVYVLGIQKSEGFSLHHSLFTIHLIYHSLELIEDVHRLDGREGVDVYAPELLLDHAVGRGHEAEL